MRFFSGVRRAADRRHGLLGSTALTGGALVAGLLLASPAAAQCVTSGTTTTCNPLNANTTINAVGANLGTTVNVLSANPGFLLQVNGAGAGSNGSVAVNVNSGVNMVSGAGQHGLLINGSSDSAAVTVIGTVTGTGGHGISIGQSVAGGTGSVTAVVNNTVTGNGAGGNGLNVQNAGLGAVTISGPGNITGANVGIVVANTNAANTTTIDIRQTGVITGGAGGGISATHAGTGNIIIGSNDSPIRQVIATGGTGILATTNGAGIVSIVTNGSVGGGIVNGIQATSVTGQISVVSGGNVTGTAAGTGISATTDGRVDVINRGVTSAGVGVTTSSAAGNTVILNEGGIQGTATQGVVASSTTGNITLINNASRIVEGATTGAGLTATGAGNVRVDNDGSIIGTAQFGVSMSSAGGSAVLENAGLVRGGGTGAFIDATGAATIAVLNEAAIIGQAGNGVQAQGQTGALYVGNAAGATINGQTNGVSALTTTGGIRVENAGTITGTTAAGVTASAAGGNVVLDNRSTVTGATFGANLATNGAGQVAAVNSGTVTATSGVGLQTTTATGSNIVANLAGGSISGTTFGINATATGAANVTVENLGTATGGIFGIQTQTVGGTAIVNNRAGAVITSPVIFNNNGGNATFNNMSTVTGGFTSTVAAGTTTINNAATWNLAGGFFTLAGASDTFENFVTLNVTGGNMLTGLEALNNRGGTITINAGSSLNSAGTAMANNSGVLTVNGTMTVGTLTNGSVINLGGTINATTITNSGLITAGPGSVMGGNVANNAGASIVSSGTLGITGNLANSGILSMQNAATGDVVAVGGTYTGGGVLGLDINFTTRAADRLTVAGAGVGNTIVALNRLGGAASDGGAIVLVQGATGATYTVNNVNLGNGANTLVDSSGLLQQFAVNTNGTLQVVSGVNTRAIGSVSAGVSAVLSSLNSFSEPASAFVTGPANPDPNKFSIGTWARVRAGQFDIKSASVVNSGILGVQTISNKMTTNFSGFQAGIDGGIYNINNSGWNVILGAHGGQVIGSAGDGDTSIKLDQPFYGAYLVVKNDAFTFDAIIRRDEVGMKVSSGTGAFLKQTQNARGWSGLTSAQYRIDITENLRVTPSVAFLFSTIDVDSLQVNGVTTRWGSLNSYVGRAGVDVSYVYALNSQVFLLPFVNASVWHEFAGKIRATSVAGGNTTTTTTNRVGTYAQVGLGTAITAPALGVTGFVRGDLRFGEKINGYAINGGVRWQF